MARLKIMSINEMWTSLKTGGHVYIETDIKKAFLYNKKNERIGSVRVDIFNRHFRKHCKLENNDRFGEIYILKEG